MVFTIQKRKSSISYINFKGVVFRPIWDDSNTYFCTKQISKLQKSTSLHFYYWLLSIN